MEFTFPGFGLVRPKLLWAFGECISWWEIFPCVSAFQIDKIGKRKKKKKVTYSDLPVLADKDLRETAQWQ